MPLAQNVLDIGLAARNQGGEPELGADWTEETLAGRVGGLCVAHEGLCGLVGHKVAVEEKELVHYRSSRVGNGFNNTRW